MRKSSGLILLILILCGALFGCGTIVPGTPWSKENEEGPLLLGNSRAETLSRCAVVPAYMSRGPCEKVFVNHRGEKVSARDLQEGIDSYLKSIPALAPWVGEIRKDGSGVTKPHRREAPYVIPYRMHILTISPIVVLAVPKSQNDQFNYCSVPGKQGCLSSPRTDAAFFYRGDIRVEPGTFWFSPDMPVGATVIPSDVKQFEILLPDSQLELVAIDGVWNVRRNALSK